VTAREYAERSAADLTPQQRADLAREDAEDFLLEAYGERVWGPQGGAR
jgi:hypothetical protein